MEVLLPLHYAGCVWYWQHAAQANTILFDQHSYFQKQSYHNRCHIAGPNGKQVLSIPTIGSHNQRPLKEMEISYSEPWQKLHWNAIKAAYGSSPFFEYYDYQLEPFYTKPFHFLADYNFQLTEWLLKQLKCKPEIQLSESFIATPSVNDFRNLFQAKTEPAQTFARYPQVFEHKYGFLPNLSIFDLLFNEGPLAKEYLKEMRNTE